MVVGAQGPEIDRERLPQASKQPANSEVQLKQAENKVEKMQQNKRRTSCEKTDDPRKLTQAKSFRLHLSLDIVGQAYDVISTS